MVSRISAAKSDDQRTPSAFELHTAMSSSSSASLPTGAASCEGGPTNLEIAASLGVLQLITTQSPSTTSQEVGRQLQDYLLASLLPTLRLAALCLARWRDSLHVRDEDFSGPVTALSLPFVGILGNSKKTELEKVPNLRSAFCDGKGDKRYRLDYMVW